MEDFGGYQAIGYRTLTTYLRPTVWIALGAVHLVFVIDNVTFLQAVFTTRFAQYLGKISFAIYICHWTLLYTLGYRLSNWTHEFTGATTEWEKAKGLMLMAMVLYPALIWASDIVARLVDQKSVTFARWLSVRVSVI